MEPDQYEVETEKQCGGVDFDSQWDNLQLTPVNSSFEDSSIANSSAVESGEKEATVLLTGVIQQISSGFQELEENFMYLGVLKKLSLPDARGFFETKFDGILILFRQIWDDRVFPEKEQLFKAIGEDYQKLNQLIHSGDAINPIYNNLKFIYKNVEQLRDAGISRQESMRSLKDLYPATK